MRALNRPNSWWGWHGYNHPTPLSITQLIQSGTVPSRLAALMWVAIERGASIILAADPPGAGKTTVLTALLSFARPETRAYFTQGWGETFELPPPTSTAPTYLLVNEMSDHLPVYSWGPYVVRIFELLAEGYSLATTMHADTAADVVGMLEQETGVASDHIARLTFIVPLLITHEGGRAARRVLDVAVPSLDGGNRTALASIARWDAGERRVRTLESPEEVALVAGRLGLDAGALDALVEDRTRFLDGLVQQRVFEIEPVEEAIASYGRAHALQG